MKVLRYSEDISQREGPVVFLAGPTVRGNQQHLKSWRFEAIHLFEANGFKGTLIVPEFKDQTASDKGWETVLVPWEFRGLSAADCIMFWVPRSRELIGLTTNHEFGYWLARKREKMVYGRPDDAYRMGYVDEMWRLTNDPERDTIIYSSLVDTVTRAMVVADTLWKVRHWDNIGCSLQNKGLVKAV